MNLHGLLSFFWGGGMSVMQDSGARNNAKLSCVARSCYDNDLINFLIILSLCVGPKTAKKQTNPLGEQSANAVNFGCTTVATKPCVDVPTDFHRIYRDAASFLTALFGGGGYRMHGMSTPHPPKPDMLRHSAVVVRWSPVIRRRPCIK